MRKSAFLFAGIAIGIFLAKQIEANPEVKKSLDNATSKVKDFSTAIAKGYKEQEDRASAVGKPVQKRATKSTPTTAKRVG